MANRKPVVWLYKSYPKPNPYINVPDMFLDDIRQYFDIVFYGDIMANPELGQEVQGATTMRFSYKHFMEQRKYMPNVKILAVTSIGYDHLNLELMQQLGIMVTNIPPNVMSGTVADHAMALLMASAREIVPYVQGLRKSHTLNINHMGVEVNGSTLGIVGLGTIGFQTAQRALGFNMKILYHQRTRKTSAEEESLGGATYHTALHEMLPLCDFVVITCPLTPATENLFGAREFALMKPTATLINVARGPIVDHDALVEALKSGQLRGAALDVTAPEPLPPQHPLMEIENVIVTPHAAAYTLSTRRAIYKTVIGNLKALLIDNTSPPNVVKSSSKTKIYFV